MPVLRPVGNEPARTSPPGRRNRQRRVVGRRCTTRTSTTATPSIDSHRRDARRLRHGRRPASCWRRCSTAGGMLNAARSSTAVRADLHVPLATSGTSTSSTTSSSSGRRTSSRRSIVEVRQAGDRRRSSTSSAAGVRGISRLDDADRPLRRRRPREPRRQLDLRRRAARCKAVQTGQLRQYVMFIVVGTVALFVLMSLDHANGLAHG